MTLNKYEVRKFVDAKSTNSLVEAIFYFNLYSFTWADDSMRHSVETASSELIFDCSGMLIESRQFCFNIQNLVLIFTVLIIIMVYMTGTILLVYD